MHIDGGCHCGYIKYETEVDPETVSIMSLHRLPEADRSAFRRQPSRRPGKGSGCSPGNRRST